MPSMRPHLSKVWHWGQQHQPQRNRGQDVPPSANSNAPQYSRHGTARGLLEGSEERATLHRPGQATSWNSTKGTPERRVESPAPVKDERSIEELSESRVREDEQRGASRYHAIETDAIREQHRTEVAILTENHRQSMVEQRFKLQVAEERNAQLLQALKSKSNDLNSAQAAWEKSKMDVSDIWQSLTEKERQLKIIEQTQADERLRHADAVAALNQEIRNTEANYKDQVASLNWRQMQEIEKLQDGHAAKISRLVQEHEDEIYRYQQDIESVKTNAEKHRRNLGVTHDEQLAQLMGQHEITVAQKEAELAQLAREEEKKRQNLTASHGEQRAQILKEHDQALSRINDELAEVRQDKEWKISQLKEAHAAELSQRDVSHAQGTRQLREDVQRLNAALLTRDDQLYQGELFTTPDLPTRPDEQIRAKFSEIEQMVDSIGRLQWRQEPAVWTSEVLRSVGGNITDRVLKKAIVQDLVWCLLSTHIFCSPFRVFGAEGRVLEEEWNEQCGQDGDSNEEEVFSWPEPGVKTERWRYMTVKECRQVLLPPVPSEWDPRMRLRKGFMDNYKESMSELKASLEHIADLTPADVKMIERLLKKAAAVWLDFATHRCRIVIRLKDSAALSMEEKVAAAQSSSLELTVVPAVGRYGNVTGADLDMYRTIDRCAGESIVIPPS